MVAYNFTIDRDYIHGGTPGELTDDTNLTDLETNYKAGIALNSNYTTIENSYISDIRSPKTSKPTPLAVPMVLGNYTVNNNYIEGTGQGMLISGGNIYLPYSRGTYQFYHY